MRHLIKPTKDKLVLVLETSCKSPCKHCFIEPGQKVFRRAKEIAEKAFDLGYSVYFYATEISPECFDVYKNVGQNEADSSICVRGDTALSELDWLVQKRGRIGFSLHGAKKETQEALSGRGSFDKTLDAIRYVAAHNPKAQMNIWSVIHKKNADEIRAVCEIARDLGIHELTFAKMGYLGRARRLDTSWFLSFEDVSKVISTVKSICESGAFPNPHITLAPNWGLTRKQASKFREGDKLPYYRTKKFCPAGVQHFTVDARTMLVYPCHHFSADRRFGIGYWSKRGIIITDDSFMNAVKNLDEPCGGCDDLDICGGGCRAEAIAEHLRLTGEYSYSAALIYCRRLVQDYSGQIIE
ncbi:SPASM domain-containing protein [Candidatus Micrarchaeota archaeon]|nr:SPASM domain-containing protein [Candidatus Micrarchaeota archaeon]MBU1166582.1 SPASM domain-containing protein [Candidatus Micrarchaeota archaeon]MBU1887286.1 SPASM domain-containing protein [Candidatus Micrarchaeota archaeon]